ncbi:50S ribosomal protein L44e [Candidatus Woesearchaeota archaeon]|jgi:large subunit ribosomal protein L44e|nr:50S ribosomal protein L44e [Candidatus Woesearchaeota archaeon]MBT4387252.1 50S ribosomal protein L44e [Candidatus Woesearchaeota archaeon]MBT4596253.1 50S ribosomal protein L44e [Candidatus Woesearchaeota archaeon]MBT5741524.1 50S ribosomal protein L44e [Candidatus Woesearchaeota archaeon]MBT6505974.1 50S ribosomal protein L44e [Candidatus Woesearchaeota archaeon]
MKKPKIMRKFCPNCKTHTEHKISSTKKKNKNVLSRGSKSRVKKRGSMGMGNHGRISRPPVAKRKRVGAKLAKRTDIRYECSECKKQWCQRFGIKTKRLEFI